MQIIFGSMLMLFTKSYQNYSMVVETTAFKVGLYFFETQCINGFIVCISKIQHIQWKSITIVIRHMWAIISTVIFDRMDCYMMLSTTC